MGQAGHPGPHPRMECYLAVASSQPRTAPGEPVQPHDGRLSNLEMKGRMKFEPTMNGMKTYSSIHTGRAGHCHLRCDNIPCGSVRTVPLCPVLLARPRAPPGWRQGLSRDCCGERQHQRQERQEHIASHAWGREGPTPPPCAPSAPSVPAPSVQGQPWTRPCAQLQGGG